MGRLESALIIEAGTVAIPAVSGEIMLGMSSVAAAPAVLALVKFIVDKPLHPQAIGE